MSGAGSARRRAAAAAARHAGAVAFSRTGEPDTAEFVDAACLGTYREVDRGIPGE